MGILPLVNNKLEEGFVLPIVDNVELVSPVLNFGTHYLAITTSVNYTGSFQPTKKNFSASKLGRSVSRKN